MKNLLCSLFFLKSLFLAAVSICTVGPVNAQVTDIEGNVYKTVTIGTQVWMAENLKTTKFNDGTAIPLVTDATAWVNSTTSGYCWYNNDAATYKATYGAMYNWYTTVNIGKLCPTGWHVPSDAEWTILTTFLGGINVAGGKLKEAGTIHWDSPNSGATNESGFSAFPSGNRDDVGAFRSVGSSGFWWSSTESEVIYAFYRFVSVNSNNVNRANYRKQDGFSIRCMQDSPAVAPTISTTVISDIAQTTATSGGNITADGGAAVTVRGICWSTTTGPTIALSTKTSDGTGIGVFTSSITGLTVGTTYYARAYATNSAGTAYGNQVSFTTLTSNNGIIFNPNLSYGTMTDTEGNVYKTISIGTQLWMAENLKTTKYKDGTDIPLVTDGAAWGALSTPGYCWYNNDATTYKSTYGALYNWYTVNTEKLCPTGWHMPSDAEWTILTTYLGGESVAGGKLNETGTTHWLSPKDATNETGFTAIPGGCRYNFGPFNTIGYYGIWWSSTEYSTTYAWCRSVYSNSSSVIRDNSIKQIGYSVRCLKGETTSTVTAPTLTTTTASSVTSTTAACGGNVTSDGGATVTARGICWSTTSNPTIANSKTSDTGTTGIYTSSITGLTAGTTYYVRAYATNSAGTAYGTEVSFTTGQMAAGTGSDYYLPLGVGNYTQLHTTVIPPGSTWGARTTYYNILRSESINGVPYFVEQGKEIMDNNPTDIHLFSCGWLRKDTNGNIVAGAYDPSGTGNLSSAIIASTPYSLFPNEFLTAGYSRSLQYNIGETQTDSVVSVTATAGSYTNCIQLRTTRKTNGTVDMVENYFYAYQVGLVMSNRTLPVDQAHTNYLVQYVANDQPVSKTVNITAGGLATALTPTELSTISILKITGTIDARDFKTMRDNMPLLTNLDISGVNVISYTGTAGPNDGNTGYAANAIPNHAFYTQMTNAGKKTLRSILLPTTLTKIEGTAFTASGLTSITIPNGVTTIEDWAFAACNLNSVSIPASLSSIGLCAFTYNSSLASFQVAGDNPYLTTIDGVLFDKMQKTVLCYPNGKVGPSYQIPMGVTVIGQSAFAGWCLEQVIIPTSVVTLSKYAFYYCESLKSVEIPASVTFIGESAFYGCSNLTSITAQTNIPVDLSSAANVFYNVNQTTCKLYVPSGSSLLYKAANQWKDFSNIIETGGFELLTNKLNIAATQGSTATADMTSSIAWSAVSDQSWLSVSPASGTGNQTFTFTAEANPSNFNSRIAIVSVSATGIEPQILTVTQASLNLIKNGNFVTDGGLPSPWGFWSANGGIAPTVVNGVAVCSPVASPNIWEYMLSQSELTALPNIPYIFSFKAWSAANRSISVDFQDTQENKFNRYGTSTDLEAINGNSDWTLNLTTVPTTYTFHVVFDKMVPTTVQYIQFMLNAASDIVYIDDVSLISVEDLSGLKLSATSATIIASGGTASVNLTTGLAWTAASNQTWLTVSPTSGTGNNTLTFTAEANPSIETRIATVTVSATGKASRTIVITQAATLLPNEYIPDGNTVLLLHLNETGGSTAYDYSGYGNNGTIIGTTVENGKFGNARRFNGNGDYIEILNSPSLNIRDSITIEAWLYDEGAGGWASKYEGPLSWDMHDGIFCISRDGNENNGLNFPRRLNEWVHLAATYDGFEQKVYINGALVASRPWQGSIASSNSRITIGTHNDQWYKGIIDEVRISNKVRTPNEFNVIRPPYALSIQDIIIPDCWSANSSILAKVYNFGLEPINSFDISYKLNGVQIASAETSNQPILPGETATYTFNAKADLSYDGNYTVEAFTFVSGGSKPSNIPLTKNFLVHGLYSKYPDWKTYSTCNGLPNNQVQYVMNDSKNNIWIGTVNGVGKMDKSTGIWTSFNTNDGLSSNNVVALLEDKDENIWACLDQDNGKVAKYNGTSWTTPNADNIHTLSAFQDSKGYIWFGTWDHGVRKYDVVNNTFTTYNTENSGLAANIVWYGNIMEDKSQNIWIGTSKWNNLSSFGTGGLCKFDGTNWTVYTTSNSGISTNGIACSLMDTKGNIWLGHGWEEPGFGVSKFDGTNWVKYNTSNSGIVSNKIMAIFEDSKGNIWFGSSDGKGVSKFDGTIWETFNIGNCGLINNSINSITEDAKGNMWFATPNGISVYNSNNKPIANAGSDQTVNEGALVTLNGTASSDPDSNPLTYLWTAPAGITLSSSTAAQPTFTAPAVTSDTPYTFTLVVNDGTTDSQADQVVITVKNVLAVNHFTPVWTGNGFDQMNINIYSAKMDGVELEAGDEVGIFDGTICVGVGKLTGAITQQSTLDIIVSKNDGSGNGYDAGNTISFKLYDASKTLEMSNVTPLYASDDPSWSTDGKFAVGVTSFAALTGATKVYQDIALNLGWNIISAYVIPANIDLKAIFQTLIDGGSLKKVMDEAGKTIENFGAFGGWKNNIGNLNSAKGYKVNVTAASTLSLEGLPVQLPLNIPLALGWNIISYPCPSAQDAKELVQPLIDSGQLKKVMDETGKTLENFGSFGGWKNNIGNFLPGKGYKVQVTESCILSITASANKSAVIVPEVLASSHFSKVFTGNGTDHFNVHLVDLASSGLQAGDQIGIFDGKFCVGAASIGMDQMISGNISIPASCNDEPIDKVNGFTVGHPVTLQLYRENQTYPLSPAKVGGSEAFEKNGSLFLKVMASDLPAAKISAGADQMKCYPNPFADQLTIDIRLTEPKKLEVSIYDLSGKLVRSLFKGDAGTSQTLFWDGTNGNGAKMGSGTYILKANEMVEKVALKK